MQEAVTLKIAQPKTSSWRSPDISTAILVLLVVAVLALLAPPLGVLFIGSLTEQHVASSFPTLTTIVEAYSRPGIYTALLNSIVFSAVVATIVLFIGGFLAWAVERTDSSIKRFAALFAVAPIVMPSLLLISAWVLLLGPRNGMINLIANQVLGTQEPIFDIFSFGGMIFVAVLQEIPLAFLWLWPVFRSINPELEEAALMSGASTFTALRKVTLAMLRPTFVASWIIFFIFAFGSISVPLLLGLPSKIFLFSTEIYLAASRFPTNTNLASAYALLYLTVAIGGMIVYRRASRDTDRFVTVSGKAFRPRLIKLGAWQYLITALAVSILFLSAVLPMLVLVWNAFMPYPQAPSVASLAMFTTSNFKAALNYGPAVRAVLNSFVLGVGAGVIATALGAAIAWYNLRIRKHHMTRASLDVVATAPVAMPGLLFGVGFLMLSLMVPFPLYGTHGVLLLAYIALHIPYAVRMCASAFGQLHPELEEAGYVSGANQYRVLTQIVIKLSSNAILASVIYITLRSFREYAASIFLTAPGTEVFSVLVLDMWEGGNANLLAAYVTMVTALVVVLLGISTWVNRRLSRSLSASSH